MNDNELDYKGHLSVLRKKFLPVIILFLAIFVFVWIKGDIVIRFIQNEAAWYGYNLVYIAPQEVIVQQMRCGLVAGLVVSLPLAIFEFLSFIRPAFETKKTFGKGILFVVLGFVMFTLGVCFAVFILLPFCLQFFFTLGVSANIQSMVSLEQFLTLCLTLLGCLGIAFETPILIIMLAKFDIASPKSMSKARPIIIIVILVLSAVITPPDVVSQCMVAIPMWLLYEMGLLIARISTRKKKEPHKKRRTKRTKKTKPKVGRSATANKQKQRRRKL